MNASSLLLWFLSSSAFFIRTLPLESVLSTSSGFTNTATLASATLLMDVLDLLHRVVETRQHEGVCHTTSQDGCDTHVADIEVSALWVARNTALGHPVCKRSVDVL